MFIDWIGISQVSDYAHRLVVVAVIVVVVFVVRNLQCDSLHFSQNILVSDCFAV